MIFKDKLFFALSGLYFGSCFEVLLTRNKTNQPLWSLIINPAIGVLYWKSRTAKNLKQRKFGWILTSSNWGENYKLGAAQFDSLLLKIREK